MKMHSHRQHGGHAVLGVCGVKFKKYRAVLRREPVPVRIMHAHGGVDFFSGRLVSLNLDAPPVAELAPVRLVLFPLRGAG